MNCRFSGKATKIESGYISAKPSIRCGTCRFFSSERKSCQIVQGKIDANGCCNLWTGFGKNIDLKYASGKDIEDIVC